MSADPNQKPAWIDEIEERPKPVRFVTYRYPDKPYKCRQQEHRLPCGQIICEWSDGTIRAWDDPECACGCDAFTDSCLDIPWVSV